MKNRGPLHPFTFWCLLLIGKIALLPFLPITPDEAYYFAWARHLQLSYFDHPPFISWIMLAGGHFWHTPFGVRLPGLVFCHLSFFIWFGILKNWDFSRRERFLWMFAIAFAPLTGLGSFVITPDTPYIFFWSLAILALQIVIKRPTVLNWMFLGISVGLGLLSKFTMVLFPLAATIVLFQKERLRFLKRLGPWIALATAMVVFTPAIVWNAQNGFASFRFQALHGLGDTSLHPWWPFELLGASIALWNPIFFFMGCFYLRRRRTENFDLAVFALLPLCFFSLAALRGHPEANWPAASAPAWMALMILALRDLNERGRKLYVFASFLSILFFVVIISHTIFPWLPLKKDADRTYITRELLPDVPVLEKYKPLYGRTYQMSAFYSYYRPEDEEVFKIRYFSRRDFYDFLPESLPPNKISYVVASPTDSLPAELQNLYRFKVLRRLPSGHALWKLTRLDRRDGSK